MVTMTPTPNDGPNDKWVKSFCEDARKLIERGLDENGLNAMQNLMVRTFRKQYKSLPDGIATANDYLVCTWARAQAAGELSGVSSNGFLASAAVTKILGRWQKVAADKMERFRLRWESGPEKRSHRWSFLLAI